MSQRAGTRDSSRHSTNKISNVRSFIILRSGEDVTSYNKDNNANFSREKKRAIKHFEVSIV